MTLLLRLIISAYSLVLTAGMSFAKMCFSKVAWARGWDLSERSRGPVPFREVSGNGTVWIHAASLGESKLLVRFLDIVRKKRPGDSYLLTATTKTGLEFLRQREISGSDIAGIGLLPLDTIGNMSRVLDLFRVRRVWVMETELWPSMIWSCITKSVPLGLVNARIEERSLRSYKRMGRLLSRLLTYPDIVLAQNATYAGRFKALGISPDRIHITGNLKSFVSVHPLAPAERAKLRRALSLDENAICITAGCLHAGEGTVLKKALDVIRASGMSCKCIVVPRHLRETPVLARELGPDAVVNAEPKASSPWNTCLIDKMGILDAMYRVADATIIGGTFDSTGGHNMWDAAQYGIPVLFGPDIHTQQESGKTLSAAGVGFSVESAEDMARTLLDVLGDGRERFIRSRDSFMRNINAKKNVIEDMIP